MQMRKWHGRSAVLAGFTVAAMLISACGGGGGGASSSTAAPSTSSGPTSSAAAPSIDVGTGTITPNNTGRIAYIVQAGKTFSYTKAQADAAVAKGEELGVAVDIFWTDLDSAKELANFQQAFTSGKYGGIIIHPLSSQLCKQIGEETVQRQVLVEVVGNALCNDGTGIGEELWAPGTISYMGGTNGVDGITDLLNKSAEMKPGPQKVLLVMGIQGHPSTVAWETAYKAFAAAHADWTLVNTVYTDFTTPGAFSTVQNALQANPDVTMAFSLYVDVTAGAAKAIEAQGLKDKISLFENGGGSTVSVELINKDSEVGSLPAYPASLGSSGVEVMVAALKGVQPPKFIPGDGNPDYAKIGVVTKENVATFAPQW